jgi:iron(III) transport system substrate-binding protein
MYHKHLAFLLVAMILQTSTALSDEVNVYSARKEALIKPLLERFSNETGIRFNLVTGKADALLKRLQSEGRNSPADLLITTDAGRLHRAKAAGVLQPVQSVTLNQAIPPPYRDPEGYWFGLSVRARTIAYVKQRVDPSALSTYEALTDPHWKNRICVRSSNNIYNQSLVASMIVADGAAEAEAWATGLVKNLARPPQGGDRDQIKAAAAGQCDIAIVNTYYLGTMLHAKDQRAREAAARVAIFWPNQEGRGVHVNVSGAAITAAAPHRENAIQLLEFLAADEAQRWYAERNHEYPVKPGVEWGETLKTWGMFKSDSVNLSLLGELNPQAVKIMDRAGWK